MRLGVIIAGGGIGRRMGHSVPKQFLPLNGIPILLHTVRIFDRLPSLTALLITAPPSYVEDTIRLCKAYRVSPLTDVLPGGKTRQQSVWKALQHPVVQALDVILVHDAVRPFVSAALLQRIVDTVLSYPAVVPAITVKDTIKQVDQHNYVTQTLDRCQLRAVQTPQAFHRSVLVRAYTEAMRRGWEATDDASLVEAIGETVYVVKGEEQNIKITTPFDLQLAAVLIQQETF